MLKVHIQEKYDLVLWSWNDIKIVFHIVYASTDYAQIFEQFLQQTNNVCVLD